MDRRTAASLARLADPVALADAVDRERQYRATHRTVFCPVDGCGLTVTDGSPKCWQHTPGWPRHQPRSTP